MQIFGVAPSCCPTVLCHRGRSRQFTLPPFILFLVFPWHTLFLNSFSRTPPLSVPSLATAYPSLPLSVSLHHHRHPPLPPPPPPPVLFLSFPLGSGAKVGRRTEANTAQGRAEGDPKAGELIMWLCVSRRPSVTPCTDRRTHASRRGLWEGGVALRGYALLFSFPFFPPSRPSSPSVLRPSPPLTYRLQVFFFFILRHLFPSFLLPYNLSPPVPLALFSVLHHGLPPVNVSIVVGCHAALCSAPFWLNGHNRRNFSRAQRDSATPC